MSVKAQIRRLKDLDVIPDHHATQLHKSYSARGWQKEEPMDREWPIPEPSLLRDALNLIVDSGTRTKAQLLAEEFTMRPADIENLSGLPSGWFNKGEASVVQLTLKAGPQKNADQSIPGEIIPFSKR